LPLRGANGFRVWAGPMIKLSAQRNQFFGTRGG
jgi:hypothetical protein